MTDHQLLDMRLCDLPVRIKGTRIEQRVANFTGTSTNEGFTFTRMSGYPRNGSHRMALRASRFRFIWLIPG
jgi:hypothetical protein